jgi:hypothetical protein
VEREETHKKKTSLTKTDEPTSFHEVRRDGAV